MYVPVYTFIKNLYKKKTGKSQREILNEKNHSSICFDAFHFIHINSF